MISVCEFKTLDGKVPYLEFYFLHLTQTELS
jgi:hypothetical protein